MKTTAAAGGAKKIRGERRGARLIRSPDKKQNPARSAGPERPSGRKRGVAPRLSTQKKEKTNSRTAAPAEDLGVKGKKGKWRY